VAVGRLRPWTMDDQGEGTTPGGILEGGGGICTYPLHTPHITKDLPYTGAQYKMAFFTIPPSFPCSTEA